MSRGEPPTTRTLIEAIKPQLAARERLFMDYGPGSRHCWATSIHIDSQDAGPCWTYPTTRRVVTLTFDLGGVLVSVPLAGLQRLILAEEVVVAVAKELVQPHVVSYRLDSELTAERFYKTINEAWSRIGKRMRALNGPELLTYLSSPGKQP